MIRAKFVCSSAARAEGSEIETVKLHAVYSSDPESENYSWSKYTPCGGLELTITNPAAHGQVKVGQEYFVDLTPVV